MGIAGCERAPSPSRAMISVPDAWQLPRMPGSLARRQNAAYRSLGETRDRTREIAPVECNRHAGELPMARRRVLALGKFRPRSRNGRPACSLQNRRRYCPVASRQASPRPRLDQIWNVQRSLTCSSCRLRRVHTLRDVADGIGALIAISGRVWSGADTDRIHHKDKGAHSILLTGGFVARARFGRDNIYRSCGRRIRQTPGAPVAHWCDAERMPRCSGVKQNVTVTSNSARASIWRSNQSSAFGRSCRPRIARYEDGARQAAASTLPPRPAGGPQNETIGIIRAVRRVRQRLSSPSFGVPSSRSRPIWKCR